MSPIGKALIMSAEAIDCNFRINSKNSIRFVKGSKLYLSEQQFFAIVDEAVKKTFGSHLYYDDIRYISVQNKYYEYARKLRINIVKCFYNQIASIQKFNNKKIK